MPFLTGDVIRDIVSMKRRFLPRSGTELNPSRAPRYAPPAVHYAVIFLCLGIGFAVAGVRMGGWGYLLLWPAASALLVGMGYAGLGGRVFGKRPDGRFAAWGYLIHLPHLLI